MQKVDQMTADLLAAGLITDQPGPDAQYGAGSSLAAPVSDRVAAWRLAGRALEASPRS